MRLLFLRSRKIFTCKENNIELNGYRCCSQPNQVGATARPDFWKSNLDKSSNLSQINYRHGELKSEMDFLSEP
jgi:hypothetical protein